MFDVHISLIKHKLFYIPANNYGICLNGRWGKGCGDQPEIVNCADIAILPEKQTLAEKYNDIETVWQASGQTIKNVTAQLNERLLSESAFETSQPQSTNSKDNEKSNQTTEPFVSGSILTDKSSFLNKTFENSASTEGSRDLSTTTTPTLQSTPASVVSNSLETIKSLIETETSLSDSPMSEIVSNTTFNASLEKLVVMLPTPQSTNSSNNKTIQSEFVTLISQYSNPIDIQTNVSVFKDDINSTPKSLKITDTAESVLIETSANTSILVPPYIESADLTSPSSAPDQLITERVVIPDNEETENIYAESPTVKSYQPTISFVAGSTALPEISEKSLYDFRISSPVMIKSATQEGTTLPQSNLLELHTSMASTNGSLLTVLENISEMVTKQNIIKVDDSFNFNTEENLTKDEPVYQETIRNKIKANASLLEVLNSQEVVKTPVYVVDENSTFVPVFSLDEQSSTVSVTTQIPNTYSSETRETPTTSDASRADRSYEYSQFENSSLVEPTRSENSKSISTESREMNVTEKNQIVSDKGKNVGEDKPTFHSLNETAFEFHSTNLSSSGFVRPNQDNNSRSISDSETVNNTIEHSLQNILQISTETYNAFVTPIGQNTGLSNVNVVAESNQSFNNVLYNDTHLPLRNAQSNNSSESTTFVETFRNDNMFLNNSKITNNTKLDHSGTSGMPNRSDEESLEANRTNTKITVGISLFSTTVPSKTKLATAINTKINKNASRNNSAFVGFENAGTEGPINGVNITTSNYKNPNPFGDNTEDITESKSADVVLNSKSLNTIDSIMTNETAIKNTGGNYSLPDDNQKQVNFASRSTDTPTTERKMNSENYPMSNNTGTNASTLFSETFFKVSPSSALEDFDNVRDSTKISGSLTTTVGYEKNKNVDGQQNDNESQRVLLVLDGILDQNTKQLLKPATDSYGSSLLNSSFLKDLQALDSKIQSKLYQDVTSVSSKNDTLLWNTTSERTITTNEYTIELLLDALSELERLKTMSMIHDEVTTTRTKSNAVSAAFQSPSYSTSGSPTDASGLIQLYNFPNSTENDFSSFGNEPDLLKDKAYSNEVSSTTRIVTVNQTSANLKSNTIRTTLFTTTEESSFPIKASTPRIVSTSQTYTDVQENNVSFVPVTRHFVDKTTILNITDTTPFATITPGNTNVTSILFEQIASNASQVVTINNETDSLSHQMLKLPQRTDTFTALKNKDNSTNTVITSTHYPLVANLVSSPTNRIKFSSDKEELTVEPSQNNSSILDMLRLGRIIRWID